MARRFLSTLWGQSVGIAASFFFLGCDPQPVAVDENTAATCSDGQDNDLDGSPDCFDLDCVDFSNCQSNPDPEICSGGVDEDEDGFIDCLDTVDCANDPACVTTAENCSNTTDDDGDGLADCDDPGCAQNPQCTANTGAGEGGGPASTCFDGQDNDNDGDANCDDSECVDECNGANTPEICNNNIDDNFDGRIDCADPQCASQPNCASNGSEICFDGIDNDGVNGTDCSDVDCFSDPLCGGGGGGGGFFEICGNGIDDDGIGGADCADITCLIDPTAGCLPGPGDCSVDECINPFNPEFLNCIVFDPCCLDPQSFECTGIPPAEVCDNNDDDDFDGAADCNDSDCAAFLACIPEVCDNTTDDNGNGQTDCADAQCANSNLCVEICDDTIDNDNDGQLDCADAGCAGAANCAPIGDGTCNAPFPITSGVAINDDTNNGIDNDFATACGEFGDGFLDLIFVVSKPTNGSFNATLSSATDLGMYVRTSCNNFQTEIACVDDEFGGTNEVLNNVPLTANQPVFLSVDGFDNDGAFTLTVTIQ